MNDWMDRAPCKAQTHLFFPDDATWPWAYDAARLICSSCPVLDDCLAYIEANPQESGMFAGMSPGDRRRRRAAAARRNQARQLARAAGQPVSIQATLLSV